MRRPDPATLALSGALGSWLLATTASQHPHRLFDGLRRYDITGLALPNWRFFAPEPAQHDYHVLHRVKEADGTQSAWRDTYPITPRKWAHVVFFANRRQEKGTFDVANEIIQVLGNPSLDVRRTVPYELLVNRVRRAVEEDYAASGKPRPQGYQFLLARHTGHAGDEEPDYLLSSPFIPL